MHIIVIMCSILHRYIYTFLQGILPYFYLNIILIKGMNVNKIIQGISPCFYLNIYLDESINVNKIIQMYRNPCILLYLYFSDSHNFLDWMWTKSFSHGFSKRLSRGTDFGIISDVVPNSIEIISASSWKISGRLLRGTGCKVHIDNILISKEYAFQLPFWLNYLSVIFYKISNCFACIKL